MNSLNFNTVSKIFPRSTGTIHNNSIRQRVRRTSLSSFPTRTSGSNQHCLCSSVSSSSSSSSSYSEKNSSFSTIVSQLNMKVCCHFNHNEVLLVPFSAQQNEYHQRTTTHNYCRMYSSTTTQMNQSKQNGNDDSESNGTSLEQSNNTSTTPLSDISSNDLKLALDSIQEDTTTDHHNQENDSNTGGCGAPPTTSRSLNLDDIPGTSTGGGNRQLAIIYTCNVCNTRSAKKFTERAYNHGVVLVRCPNCESLHLIADRLGYFTDEDEVGSNSENKDDGNGENKKKGWDIEKFMKNIGKEDNIKVMTNGDNGDVLEVTIDDVIGKGNNK